MTYIDEMNDKAWEALRLIHRDLLDSDYSLLSIEAMEKVSEAIKRKKEFENNEQI